MYKLDRRSNPIIIKLLKWKELTQLVSEHVLMNHTNMFFWANSVITVDKLYYMSTISPQYYNIYSMCQYY